MSSPHDTPFTVTHDGRGRGPSTNVPANPVLNTPQAGPGPAPTGGGGIDHSVHGPKPHIEYQPGTVSDPPQLDLGDLHSPLASPAVNIDAPSTADVGGLAGPVQGIQSVDGIGEGPSGIRVDLSTPDIPLPIRLPGLADAPPPPTSTLGPTSAVNEQVPPWHDQGPSHTPAPQTSPTGGQVWDSTVEIGVNQPWPGRS